MPIDAGSSKPNVTAFSLRIEWGADSRTHQRRISVIIMSIVTSAAAHTISNLVSQSASWFSFVGTPTAEHLHETTSFYCFLGQPAPTVVIVIGKEESGRVSG